MKKIVILGLGCMFLFSGCNKENINVDTATQINTSGKNQEKNKNVDLVEMVPISKENNTSIKDKKIYSAKINDNENTGEHLQSQNEGKEDYEDTVSEVADENYSKDQSIDMDYSEDQLMDNKNDTMEYEESLPDIIIEDGEVPPPVNASEYSDGQYVYYEIYDEAVEN